MNLILIMFWSIILLFTGLISNAGDIFITLRSSHNYFVLSKEVITGVDSKVHCKRSPTSSRGDHQFSEDVINHNNKIGDSVAKGGANASKLSGKTRIIYDDLLKVGFKASDEGAEILFKNADNTLVAKISDDALHIKIPDNHGTGGWATQSTSTNAVKALNQVNEGALLYRIGTLNRSAAAEAQYWSLENPMDIKSIKDFAVKYGIPESNLETGQFFVEIAKPKAGMPRISREAPAFGNNPGVSIEIVVPTNGVQLESFHTIKF